MKTMRYYLIFSVFAGVLTFNSINVQAHCDTMNGPVITAAKAALNKGDVKLILIWVQPKDEAAITELFNKTLKLRKINPEVQELADRYFFENLVRIHRAGEGEPFTGIKDSTEVEPPIATADKALETGSLVDVMKMLNEGIEKGVKEKFDIMMIRKNYDKKNVEAGREFVEAYVAFMHYVESIYNTTSDAEAGEHKIEIGNALSEKLNTASNENIFPASQLNQNPERHDYLTHILIIVGTLLIIIVQITLSRKK
ncbi:MAG TPA: DUF6448 family protein [Ignavibacteria bacterium]